MASDTESINICWGVEVVLNPGSLVVGIKDLSSVTVEKISSLSSVPFGRHFDSVLKIHTAK